MGTNEEPGAAIPHPDRLERELAEFSPARACRSSRAVGVAVALTAFVAGHGSPALADSDEFQNPQPVTIEGYAGDAMEPFVTCDDRFLLFNDRDTPESEPNLHWAERVDATTFDYRGELTGANSDAFDAVASVACDGTMVFVSTRSYGQTLSTLYRANFSEGAVTGVELLDGLSLEEPGWVNFDIEIAPDGGSLWFVDGLVDATPPPEAADLVLATATGTGFERAAEGPSILAAVNSDALEYAAAITADGLELFFTRYAAGATAILRSTRSSTGAPFSAPEPVSAAAGFVEAPALGPDGLALYYHRGASGAFSIYRATRQGTFAVFRDGFESGTTGEWVVP